MDEEPSREELVERLLGGCYIARKQEALSKAGWTVVGAPAPEGGI